MPAPDPLVVRAYNSQVERHRSNARQEAASIRGRINAISADLESGSVTMPLGSAKNMAREVADLIAALSALAVLADLEFPTTDQDAKEA